LPFTSQNTLHRSLAAATILYAIKVLVDFWVIVMLLSDDSSSEFKNRGWTLIGIYAFQSFLSSLLVLAVQRWKDVGLWLEYGLGREIFYVIIQVKLVVDFFRTIAPKTSYVKQMENAGVGTFREEVMSSFSVIAATSMTISMCHGNTLLTTSQNPNLLCVAIAMNIFTPTLALAIVTLDKDCDTKTRRTMGEFYGIFSEQPLMKTIAFCSLLTFSIAQLVAKTIAFVLLDVIVGNYMLYIVLSVQIGLYSLYKVARGDYMYWVQLGSPTPSALIAFMIRTFEYIISTSTGYPKFRHPLDMGGRVWTMAVMCTHIECIGVLYYCTKYEPKRLEDLSNPQNPNPSVEPEMILYLYWGVAIVWLLSALTFYNSIEAKYRRTFWDNSKGSDFLRANFKNATDDEIRAEIFDYSFNYWGEENFNKEVREWLEVKWGEWR
jgi:hypothetical protein